MWHNWKRRHLNSKPKYWWHGLITSSNDDGCEEEVRSHEQRIVQPTRTERFTTWPHSSSNRRLGLFCSPLRGELKIAEFSSSMAEGATFLKKLRKLLLLCCWRKKLVIESCNLGVCVRPDHKKFCSSHYYNYVILAKVYSQSRSFEAEAGGKWSLDWQMAKVWQPLSPTPWFVATSLQCFRNDGNGSAAKTDFLLSSFFWLHGDVNWQSSAGSIKMAVFSAHAHLICLFEY